MALKAHKTEHCGPKMGRGAYYGRRADAKHDSNRQRRHNDEKATDIFDPEASNDGSDEQAYKPVDRRAIRVVQEGSDSVVRPNWALAIPDKPTSI